MSAKHDKRKMTPEEQYDQWMRLLLLEPVAGQTDVMDAMKVKFSQRELNSGAFHTIKQRKEKNNETFSREVPQFARPAARQS